MDVILLFVSKTSTFYSLNSYYFEIFGFIRIDCMCFSNKLFLEIYSVFPKQMCVFLLPIIYKKNYLNRYYDILQMLTIFLKHVLFYKVIFCCFQYI